MSRLASAVKSSGVRVLIALAAIQLLTPLPAHAGLVSYSGTVRQSAQSGFTALGTFKPGFDPYSLYSVYKDPGGNLLAFYGRSVADGNFRPLTNGLWSGQTFSGTADITGIGGQRLWVYLFDQSNPDQSLFSTLCSGSDAMWLAPADAGTSTINCNSADMFVLGEGGHGAPLSLSVLPFPEPSAGFAIFVIGIGLLCSRAWRFR